MGKDIYFFHKKLYVYPEFYIKTKKIDTRLKYSHLTLSDLNSYYPEIFLRMREFDFYVSVRDPYKRFISSLIQYFGEKKIDLSVIDNFAMSKLIQKIIIKIKNDNFLNDISLFSFKKQSEYIFFENEQIVKNIYNSDNSNKLIEDINSKYGIYFKKLKIENVSQNIQINPFNKFYIARFIPKIFKENIKKIYNVFLPNNKKIFKIKYERALNDKVVVDFIKDYYQKDFLILKKI